MKLVKVVDHRRTYEKNGVKLASQSYRLYSDNGHYVTVKPSFEKNSKDWYALALMAIHTIEIDEKGNVLEVE